MSVTITLPNAEQFDTMNILLASIASQSGGVSVKSFKDVQTITRRALHNKVFVVGDQFETERESSISASFTGEVMTSVSVNAAVFLHAVGTAHEGIYEATYDGAVWHKENGDSIILADYGITVTGNPAEGDRIVITETTRKLLFDVVDFDKNIPSNPHLTSCVNLLLHNVFVYGTIPFSAPQLLYYTRDGLPAGTYRIILDHAAYGGRTDCDGDYMFTLTQPIPAGGGFRHKNIGGSKTTYSKNDVLGNHLETYQPVANGGALIETATVYEAWATPATLLGTFTARDRAYYTEDDAIHVGGKRNFTERNACGSNRWKTSALRQWLNSDAEAVAASGNAAVSNWWTPQTVFDRIPGGAKWAGFMYGLADDFVNALGTVEVKTALHTCDRVGDAAYEITEDKIFLASRQNIYGSNEYSGIDEGGVWEYFKDAANADRSKHENTTARGWWMRTPYSIIASGVRNVGTSGNLDGDLAYGIRGVVPACCIV